MLSLLNLFFVFLGWCFCFISDSICLFVLHDTELFLASNIQLELEKMSTTLSVIFNHALYLTSRSRWKGGN